MAATATPATVPPIVNVLVRAVLRTPLLHRVLSRDTMLLTLTGRSSGKSYTFPVSYQREGDTITCYTSTDRTWWKNLRGQVPVTLVLAGRTRHGVADVVTQDPERAVQSLRAFLLNSPRDARYHGVALDQAAHPDATDLERAAQAGVMVWIRLAGR